MNDKQVDYNQLKPYFPIIIISDTHLGKKFSQADMLLEFLQTVDCGTLILNGDIIDGWAISEKKQMPFPEMHRRVIDAINAKVSSGTKVFYIPGNHDMTLRGTAVINRKKNFYGINFQEVLNHKDKHGKNWFLLHGDQYDGNMLKGKGKILYHIGDNIYDSLVAASISTGKLSHKLLKKRFSAAAYIKHKTKSIIQVIGDFENAVINSALQNNADGIICGHIHTAEWREINLPQKKKKQKTIYYGNSGDWVESCTALTQDHAGKWEIMHWADERHKFGFSDPTTESDPNLFAHERQKTNRQLLWVNRLWGGKNKDKMIQAFMEAKKEITNLQNQSVSIKKAKKIEKLEQKMTKLRPIIWPNKT